MGQSLGSQDVFSPTHRHGEARSCRRACVCMCSMDVCFHVCVHACAGFMMQVGV